MNGGTEPDMSTPRILMDSSLPSGDHAIIRPTPLRAPFVPPINGASPDIRDLKKNGYFHFEKPERDICEMIPNKSSEDFFQQQINADSGFVTNVMIDNRPHNDSGYRILEDEEEDEPHTHPSFIQGKSSLMKYKSKRRQVSIDKSYQEEDLSLTLEKANRLLDVKAALEQMTVTGPTKANAESSSSGCTSEDDGDSSRSSRIWTGHHGRHSGRPSKPSSNNLNIRKPRKQSSIENLNGTTIASAGDEFVWIDSHNRLVELQCLPWTSEDLHGALPSGVSERVSVDLIPRLSYCLQRTLVRIGREIQRLSKPIGKCGTKEVVSAIKMILSTSVASNAIKACLRAAAMYTISGNQGRQTKSARSGLKLKVGKMHHWMIMVRLGKFVHENAAIYLTAALENILEQLFSLDTATESKNEPLTAASFERAVSLSPDFWGLFQPTAHLSLSRTATGTLVPPQFSSCHENHGRSKSGKTLDQILLTTCVGSVAELEDATFLASSALNSTKTDTGVHKRRSSSGIKNTTTSWSKDSILVFYHFMRCSQLEYVSEEGRAPTQELMYERPFIVLPPLAEWIRVAGAFCEYRDSNLIDRDDVLQAARILLPGMDCPIRYPFDPDTEVHSTSSDALDELQIIDEIKSRMAFKMLLSGRRDLLPHALQLLGSSTKLDTADPRGFTLLQIAAIKGDLDVIKILVETGASVDGRGKKKWTPLCFSALGGHLKIVKFLLDKGANPEGVENTETPLQLAAGSGSLRIIELLLAHGASPFYDPSSEFPSDNLSLSSKEGATSAVSIAAIHGHRRLLHTMVTHVVTSSSGPNSSFNYGENEVLSLEEILAEGSSENHQNFLEVSQKPTLPDSKSFLSKLSKPRVKKIQEAMYHASESGNLEITLDLRNLGIPWTLHTWLLSVAGVNSDSSAYLDELLQDFLSEWQSDDGGSKCFIEEGLPLLFSLFKSCKSEGTLLLLADIFSVCYGTGKIETVLPPPSNGSEEVTISEQGSRIDPKFVNNPELSDVQFRVDGRIFYAHKLVLITASSRFQAMINSRYCEGIPPVLQINDIRYDIFHLVMVYLYHGGSDRLQVKAPDVLELMAAANFFQLPGLLRYCEYRCSDLVDLDNVVSYFIHAKVYSAERLLEFCEGFLLQNMVALLTYDDSVKRLIIGKKLQSHDVLMGLLQTLQKRMSLRSNR